MTIFSPIKTTRVADGIFQQIKASIQRGDYAVGAKLPSERALAEQFSVNRAGVREALRALEAIGMVEVRHGLGCYAIRDTESEDTPSIWIPWLLVHRDEVLALLDVRESLEMKAAALAASRITETELAGLEQILNDMRVAAANPAVAPAELSELDVRFHDAIARASKNRFLIELLEHCGSAFETDRYAIFAVPARPAGSVEEHAAIIDAIRQRDPVHAADRMTMHVANVRKTIQTVHTAEGAKPIQD